MNRTLVLILAVIAILVGPGLVMPAVAKLRLDGSLPGSDIALLLSGITITFVGLMIAARNLRRPVGRN